MNLSNNTILITGGATGIGLALAEEFMIRDNTVIICGRRSEKLKEANEKNPDLHTFQCDLRKHSERIKLFEDTILDFPNINVLINNAGIQLYLDFLAGVPDEKIESEITANLIAPIHLTSLFIPHLLKKDNPAIMNVSSGLAFVPIYRTPIYCATKAAIHSFTMTLRVQLQKTLIKVFELAPPTVDTDLDKGEREKHGVADRGISAEACAKEMMENIAADNYFAPIGQAKNLFYASQGEGFENIFKRMNGIQ